MTGGWSFRLPFRGGSYQTTLSITTAQATSAKQAQISIMRSIVLLSPRNAITAVHREGMSEVAERVKALYTEGCIKATLNEVEFSYSVHDGCCTT